MGQERAWVQFARSNNKPIVELKRVVEDPPFPHWSKFVTKLSALESLPGDWQKALKILTGIYLLSDSETGEARYVGQADGTGGFLARWTEYARNGHGGNLAMQALEKNDYMVRILAIGAGEELGEKESHWKTVLGTRVSALGLNRN